MTGGPSGLVGVPAFQVGSFAFDTPARIYWLALGLAVVLVVPLEGGMRSSFGRALKAVRTDQLAAAALGINVGRMKIAALCISGALASLSGSLYAFQFHFLSPEMVATPRSFEMIAMLVLGGEGTLLGGLFGALVITLLPTLVQSLAVYKTAVEGALLVATFLLLPEGIFGRARHVDGAGRSGRARPRADRGGTMTRRTRCRPCFETVRRPACRRRRDVPGERGQPDRPDRPERGRQDDALQR